MKHDGKRTLYYTRFCFDFHASLLIEDHHYDEGAKVEKKD
jgi:hypothetical protein